jgi:Protein of unknown function (DUF2922).
MAAMTRTLNMVFTLEGGAKELTLSLTDPKDGLSKAAVESVMTEMIEKKALLKGSIPAIAIKSASIREVNTIALA